jgi:enediyne biosynthesis thioesterase
MKAFEYQHIVPFEETNLVGNVYFTNHIRWQGHCREAFLREYVPEILEELTRDLRLVTLRCSCEYLAELRAFDRITLRMRLGALMRNRLTLEFEYWEGPDPSSLAARGEQQIACMRDEAGRLVPTPIPDMLGKALEEYAS